ncbi:MAG: hypothetical protein Kow0069_30590 [Promethearchaeota archaeon]
MRGSPTSGHPAFVTVALLLAVGLPVARSVVTGLPAAAAGDATPRGIHQTFGVDPRTTRALSWYTSGPAASKVFYGMSPGDLSAEGEGTTQVVQGTYVHHVKLTGLSSNATYFYRVGDPAAGEGALSDVRNFTTAPPRKTDALRFWAFGDMRSNWPVRRLVANVMVANANVTFPGAPAPAFVLASGDLVAKGTEQHLWNQLFDDYEGLHRHVPLVPVVGNHEFDAGRSAYRENFVLPENGHDEWYYSFSWGMAHFVAADSETHGFPPYDLFDLNWLEKDAERAAGDPAVLWRFAFWHAPPFVSASHAPRDDIARNWWPILDDAGFDLAFTGHCHLYERTYPVAPSGVPNATGDPDYYAPEHPVLLVTGAAGMGEGPDQLPEREEDYSAFLNGSYHYCDVLLANDHATRTTKMTVKVVAVVPRRDGSGNVLENETDSWRLLDQFSITKPIPDAWYDVDLDVSYADLAVAGLDSPAQVIGNVLVVAGLVGVAALVLRRRARSLAPA